MNRKWIRAGAIILLMAMIVSLAACKGNSSSVETERPSNVTSQVPVQTHNVEPTESEDTQETPSTQPTGEGQNNKYFLIKCDAYDGSGTLMGRREYEYDENGNLLRDSVYTLDGIVSEARIFEYIFYQDGTISEKRMTEETPEESSISNYSYDEHGNLIAYDRQSQKKNPVEYGSVYVGGSSSMTSELGRVYSHAPRTFTYDSSGYAIRFDMTSKSNGEALGWGEITYNAAGTAATYNVYDRDNELDYQGETLYDADHRALSVKYMEDGEITDWFEYEYDEYGHLISSSTHVLGENNFGIRWIYIYDSEGRFLSESMYLDDTLMNRSEATEWIPFPTAE